MHALEGEQLARNGADMFLVSRVDFVAPLARLLVQILPTGERAARKKVVFDEVEVTLDARRAIGIAALMGHKAETGTLGEGFHLGHGNHLAARSSQYHHVRVVDHHALRRTAHVTQRIGEENFAVEALERGIDLEKQHV